MNKRKAVLDLFEEMGLDRISGHNRNITLACPFAPYTDRHKSDVDKRPSFAVLPHNDRPCDIQCFTCGFKASGHNGGVKFMVSALAEHDPERWEEFVEAAEDIEYPVGDALLLPLQGRSYLDKLSNFEGTTYEEIDYALFEKKYHRYLERRGITKETAKVWEATYDPEQRRVVFPVRRFDRTLVGAVGRAVDSQASVKYLHYWKMRKANVLFGEQLLRIGSRLVVVEGVLDAVFVWQTLYEAGLLEEFSVVATLGHAVSDFQRDRIVQYAKEAIVFMDNDEPGQLASTRLCRKMYRKTKTYVVSYGDSQEKDPGALMPERIVRMIRRAQLFSP